ncbi:hypothetical protein [Cupriavidus pinatubonensis]|uniref:hypothetical protein n=1 Tax=Cupriavidus pinatubonensis TaxID=248026 RepID=UPI00112A020E|nr:hypothetical protein [Cupriavidus pinatubonensis]
MQATIKRAAQFAACFPAYDSMLTSSAYHIILGALRRHLDTEPCLTVDAPKPPEEELIDYIGRATRSRASRRRYK